MVRIRVWDLPLRLFHWSLVVTLTGSFITGLAGDELGLWAAQWHKLFGYAVLSLLLFRLLWGFSGSTHSRFGSFLRGPRAASEYLAELLGKRAPRTRLGHNPLGGWSVVAMLLSALMQAGTGLFLSDEDLGLEGPLAGLVSSATADRLGSVHEANYVLLLVLIGLHLCALVYYRFVKGENLITPMITGVKELPAAPENPPASGGSIVLAVILLLCSVGMVWVIANRP